MQFEVTSTFLGCNRMNIDGRVFCSVFTGQEPVGDNAANTRGYEVTKIGSEPEVFDQLGDVRPGASVTFIAVLRRAAGGKSQPFLVGVAPDKSASKPVTPSAQSTDKAGAR